MNAFDFFQQHTCLTMGGTEQVAAQQEFSRVGLYVEWFKAIPSIGPHQSFNISTKAILQKFYDSGAHSLLFLEDDCAFKNLETLWPALQEVPADWDILYMGCNIQSDAVRITNRIYKITAAWTTHCIAYTRPVVRFILENQPGESEQMYDNWLSSVLPQFNAYVVKPMVAIQRPRYSKIWNKHVDYTKEFQAAAARMI